MLDLRPPPDASAPPPAAIPARDPSARLLAWVVFSMALAGAATFALCRTSWAPRGIQQGTAFWVLFREEEPLAAALGLFLAAAAFLLAGRLPRRLASAIEDVGSRPALAIAAFAAAAAAASWFVYRSYPLSMDEYAPWLQAKAFAAGHLTGQIPPALLARFVPFFRDYFLDVSRDGRIVEAYWPGFALLLAPFMRLGVPWLLNPLIGAASLALLWHLARRLLGERAAAWVLLLTLASPAFLANAISFYSMSAHLLFSLLFAALLIDGPTPGRAFLAGLVGSFALTLHNPFPHALFAAPWFLWMARQPRRRHLAALLLGYVPLGLLLGVGWWQLRASILSSNPLGGGHSVPLSTMVAHAFEMAFALPSAPQLWARLAGFVKLVLWASPGLLALACIGAAAVLRDPKPERTPLRLLTLSGVATLGAYLLVPWDQGHGWGYRYFHSAWGVLPILASVPMLAKAPGADRALRAVLGAALASVVLSTPLRLHQMSRFIGRHLAQLPSAPPTRFSVTFVRPWRGFYTIDMVHNDPFLDSDRWMLYSHGDAEDALFARRLSASARVVAANDVATVWEIPAPR